ncbi:hypothetical protein [Virgibacillus kimchii]
MSENKFRIWDKKNKKFIDLEYTDRQLSIDPLSGKVIETEVDTGERYFLSTCKELEIIGNRFENPELLEGESHV